MYWKGTKKYKEAITNEGYHLKAQYVEQTKYWWIVYKQGEIIARPVLESDYGKSMQLAKSKARQKMIKDLKKE